jgi:hypothetical protein
VGFKEAIKEYGKEITASFTWGGVTYSDEDIISMNPHFEGSLLSSVMKCLDIEIKGDNAGATTEETVISSVKFGVKAPGDADYSYIEYGTYIIKEKKKNEEQQTIVLECYDLMLQSMIPYDHSFFQPDYAKAPPASLTLWSGTQYAPITLFITYGDTIAISDGSLVIPDAKTLQYDTNSQSELRGKYISVSGDYYYIATNATFTTATSGGTKKLTCNAAQKVSIVENPTVTVKTLLDKICDRLDWVVGYTTFRNSDVVIDGEKFDSTYTFRDVLDQIAQVAGGMVGFVGDELKVIYPTDSGEVIDEENLKSLKMGKRYGPINSVVLARTPQEDNIYKQDTDSITDHGITEIRIENNQIIDSHREDFIDGICAALFGVSFELYELESFGIGYLNLGEYFTIKTADGVAHKTLMLCDDLQITQGVSETSSIEEPEVTKTDYSTASETDKTINKTILRVNKQENQITALVSKTETLGETVSGVTETVTKMAEVMIDSDSLEIKISKAIEGIDSIETSTGYTFDENGLNIHKDGEEMHNTLDNTGMYVRRDGDDVLTANNDGVNAINLKARQYLIIGENSRLEDYNDGTGSNRTACFFIGV